MGIGSPYFSRDEIQISAPHLIQIHGSLCAGYSQRSHIDIYGLVRPRTTNSTSTTDRELVGVYIQSSTIAVSHGAVAVQRHRLPNGSQNAKIQGSGCTQHQVRARGCSRVQCEVSGILHK